MASIWEKPFQFWREIWIQVVVILLKLRFCEKATKVLGNHQLKFVLCSNGQIFSGDFAKLCGLLRIYELYIIVVSKVVSIYFFKFRWIFFDETEMSTRSFCQNGLLRKHKVYFKIHSSVFQKKQRNQEHFILFLRWLIKGYLLSSGSLEERE